MAEKGEIEKVGLLKNSKDVLTTFVQPETRINEEQIKNELSLVLDCVQNPDNLGKTIHLVN